MFWVWLRVKARAKLHGPWTWLPSTIGPAYKEWNIYNCIQLQVMRVQEGYDSVILATKRSEISNAVLKFQLLSCQIKYNSGGCGSLRHAFRICHHQYSHMRHISCLTSKKVSSLYNNRWCYKFKQCCIIWVPQWGGLPDNKNWFLDLYLSSNSSLKSNNELPAFPPRATASSCAPKQRPSILCFLSASLLIKLLSFTIQGSLANASCLLPVITIPSNPWNSSSVGNWLSQTQNLHHSSVGSEVSCRMFWAMSP